MSPVEHWDAWKSICLKDNPGDAFRVIFESGASEHYPQLHAVRDTPQDVSWHPEGGVAEHLCQAANIAAARAKELNLSDEHRTRAVLAALCHDIGKADHTVTHSDGRITSQGHDVAGAPVAEEFILSIGGREEMAKQVGVLVKTHMRHVNAPTRRSVTKLVGILREVNLELEDWCVLADADCGGRGEAAFSISDGWRDIAREFNI